MFEYGKKEKWHIILRLDKLHVYVYIHIVKFLLMQVKMVF